MKLLTGQTCPCSQAAALSWILPLLWLNPAGAARGMLQGDEYADLFVNSVYIRPDRVTPMLLMNSAKRYDSRGDAAVNIFMKRPLKAGDLIALSINSKRPHMIGMKTPIGTVDHYHHRAGFILTFDDGTVTNARWKCAVDYTWGGPVTHAMYDRWHSRNPLRFDDSSWPYAVEQNSSTDMPWRDKLGKWDRFSAKWISATTPKFYTNGSAAPESWSLHGPRKFFCRYRVQAGPDGHLMDGGELHASPNAPKVNVTGLRFSQHISEITFKLDRAAEVTCGILDARFELRPPTQVELLKTDKNGAFLFGWTKYRSPTEWAWTDVTHGQKHRAYTDAALAWFRFDDIGTCKRMCGLYKGRYECGAITFYDKGSSSVVPGANCKLMHNMTTLAAVDTPGARFLHLARQREVVVTQMHFSAMLAPGTVYYCYCFAKDVTPGSATFGMTSNWSALGATRLDARTEGCIDCGATAPPEPRLMGGYASHDRITLIMQVNTAGRIFCAARDLSAYGPDGGGTPWTVREVMSHKYSNLVLVPFTVLPVVVMKLRPSTPYAVYCVAETEGGTISSEQDLVLGTRRMYTTGYDTIIESLVIKEEKYTSGEMSVVTEMRVKKIGYLWCQIYNTTDMRNLGVPRSSTLEKRPREKIPLVRNDGGGVFDGLLANKTYEVYCAGKYNDFRNESDALAMSSPLWNYATEVDILYDRVVLKLMVSAPARKSDTYCKAFRWAGRPFSERPALPTWNSMKYGKHGRRTIVEKGGGKVFLKVLGLTPGTLYDLYCFTQEMEEPVPFGAIPPAVATMNMVSFRNTRITFRTQGPEYRDHGWHCVAGQYCSVTGIRGVDLNHTDEVIVRSTPCRDICKCNGREDITRKGAECSPVSQEMKVHNPNQFGEVDIKDPRGDWCYVDNLACDDGEPSPTFSNLLISYRACIYLKPITRAGAGPVGFPNNGLSWKLGRAGTGYFFGNAPLLTHAFGYNLCWCNGTESKCTEEQHFHVRIGVLYVGGPTIKQNQSSEVCLSNRPCKVWHFNGENVANGNRLVALPDTKDGCLWKRQSYADPPGIPGFPNNGVSLPATGNGFSFSWGTMSVNAEGNRYLLCWCGAVFVNGSSACPNLRPDSGEMYLQPAGYLSLVGPKSGLLKYCSVGLECVLPGIIGTGLVGGDRAMITEICGEASPKPKNWTMGLDTFGSVAVGPKWLEGGWLLYDSRASDSLHLGFGSPTASGARSGSTGPRGVWGMPNNAISQPDARLGYYSWRAPSFAIPGKYQLCWCPAGYPCTSPSHFGMIMGEIWLEGPHVLPAASQTFICVRDRRCRVVGLQGAMPIGGTRLFIPQDFCGGKPAYGVPMDGASTVSLGSGDDSLYSWGPQPIIAPAGKYRLCWCTENCFTPDAYQTFAGVLRVKAPFGPPKVWSCGLKQNCTIDGVLGEALHGGDKIAAMTKCGDGDVSSAFGYPVSGQAVSMETAPDGSWFKLPPVEVAGSFRICWCADEIMCARGENFNFFIGTLLVGGPDASALYVCHEWAPCEIRGLLGTFLNNGDRLRAIPASVGCGLNSSTNSSTMEIVPGFPESGLSNPATDNGKTFSWASRILSDPGVYDLCWCSVGSLIGNGSCGEDGPFYMSAGSLRIGTAKEWNFAKRPVDPEPRSMDWLYGVLLGMMLPIVAVFVACFMLKRKYDARMYGVFAEATNPFEKPKSQLRQDQDKLKLTFDIKTTSAIRHLALGDPTEEESTREGVEMTVAGPSPTSKLDDQQERAKFGKFGRNLGSLCPERLEDKKAADDDRDLLPGQLAPAPPMGLPPGQLAPPPPKRGTLAPPPPAKRRNPLMDPDDDSLKPAFPRLDLSFQLAHPESYILKDILEPWKPQPLAVAIRPLSPARGLAAVPEESPAPKPKKLPALQGTRAAQKRDKLIAEKKSQAPPPMLR